MHAAAPASAEPGQRSEPDEVGTVTAAPSFASTATAPLPIASATKRVPSTLVPGRAANRNPGVTARLSAVMPVTSMPESAPGADISGPVSKESSIAPSVWFVLGPQTDGDTDTCGPACSYVASPGASNGARCDPRCYFSNRSGRTSSSGAMRVMRRLVTGAALRPAVIWPLVSSVACGSNNATNVT